MQLFGCSVTALMAIYHESYHHPFSRKTYKLENCKRLVVCAFLCIAEYFWAFKVVPTGGRAFFMTSKGVSQWIESPPQNLIAVIEVLFFLRSNFCSELLSKELLALNGFSEIVLLPQIVVGTNVSDNAYAPISSLNLLFPKMTFRSKGLRLLIVLLIPDC